MTNHMLDQSKIDNLFATCAHQGDVLIGIYKTIMPEWDNIRKIAGWPTINDYTWKYICEGFIQFDRKHHPDVLAGGAWMNSGFTVDNKLELDDWQYQPVDPDKILYKGQKNTLRSITIDKFGQFMSIRFYRLFELRDSHYAYRRVTQSSLVRLYNLLKDMPCDKPRVETFVYNL